MIGFEENEISEKSHGGTEISKRSIAKFINEYLAKEFQSIPSRLRELNPEKIRVYWHHDLAEDPEVSHLASESGRNKFHKMVFVSNWQLQDFNTKLRVPLNETVKVIENPIDPFPEHQKPTDTINLIYFSTPQRGLELVVPVVDELSKKYPNIRLDVFSSFKIYGWDDADKNYEPLYDRIRNHPNMRYYGFVKQEELRKALQEAHILAYPCVWKETSCRVLMESMSAGLMCVHPNLAALPDTGGGLTSMYQFNEDVNKHANIFYSYLEHAILNVNRTEAQNYLRFAKAYADSRFNINKIASQWEGMLIDLKDQYPTIESRKIPSELFVYKT